MHANNFETTENGLCFFFPGRLAGIMVPALPEGEQRMPLQAAGSLISQLLATEEDLATEEELAAAEAELTVELQEVEEWELQKLQAVESELGDGM